ncbi:MAG: hypothetical protein ACHQ49_00515, partial [Elusimicrobiota bacterium]
MTRRLALALCVGLPPLVPGLARADAASRGAVTATASPCPECGGFVAYRFGMKYCPDCRAPLPSLMLLESKVELEYYCERCAHGWPVVEAPAPTPT